VEIIPSIDPLYALGANVNVNKVRTKKEAEKEFVSVFLSQVMKDVFKAQSSMFGDEGALGAFSNNMFNDIMMQRVTADMVANKAYGFDKILAGEQWQ
jgi:hypothetical protein